MERTMMSERDDGLLRIRPNLDITESRAGTVEEFQNLVLRPILKFQNSIVLAQFKRYIKKFKPAFNAYNSNVQRNYVEDVLKKDPRIKNSLIATVVSLMTLEEYDYYCQEKDEVNKRIVMLLTKRIQDNLEQLY